MNEALGKLDYDISSFANIDNATEISVHMVLSDAKRFIPTRILREFKGTHPWLNDECRSAILHKQSCAGTDEYKEACESCTRILQVAFAAYTAKLRQELRSLPKGSKRWWSLSNGLLDNAPSKAGIPSLKDPEGNWIHDGRGKADLLAQAFASKFELPDPVEVNTDIAEAPPAKMMDFVLVRERWVLKELLGLREDQATGMDELPARILRQCGRALARNVTALIRNMLALGR